ncbi:MMPL family transporter [Leucobacter luti]|uniref:RND superfamily putative drug exporter n=1 Tax=Leucobacter luti TaxID=340320 RepID=A0A4Q7TRP3_9MICO|nr:MMPL family transporter [Leucobacter luti]MBL3700043.1 MMPL family transporter [Leucobacter luti]RZT62640.1 RND superfamily putative drug exporter [Leucobacter luti]
MATPQKSPGFSGWLTSRGGAWLALGAVLLIMTVLFGAFGSAKAPAQNASAPPASESARAAELMQQFPNAERQSVLVVATPAAGGELSAADLAAAEALLPLLDERADAPATGPLVSEDGGAALLVVPIAVGDTNGETAELIGELRADLAAQTPSGLELLVTGGPAFGADVAAAFDGANFTLLFVTILIVAILLIATYRSPILWLIPLVAVALADGLAGRLTAAAGSAWGLQFDAGIISVLVFGAGTNYALLLISRYREELLGTDDHRAALAAAWRKTAPAIIASNLTVVLALLTLALAVIPGTRGLGVSAAIGLLVALAVVLFLLPPLLAVCGRGVFWPFVPRPGQPRSQGRLWRGVATRVGRRPVASLLGGVALLAVMSAGLIGTSVGLDQVEKFRVQSESAAGLETLSEHFAPGEAQPIYVVAESGATDAVVSAARGVVGVVRAHPVGETADGTLTKIMVTSEYAPSSEASLDQIGELRAAVHEVPGADAVVGGAVATDVDARAGNQQDLWLIAPLVLLVSFAVLALLLRALVAPLLLLAVNLASALAAIGAGAWLSRVVFGQHALDLQVPLLAFMFLVALGIDYTIFLVHRARAEAETHGTRGGIVEAVAHTGGVITSAGIVLAAVFAALGVLPLVTLGQLGLIVGIGVVVDTLVVRTVIVPALFTLVGDRMWWPGKMRRSRGESTHEHRERTAVAH